MSFLNHMKHRVLATVLAIMVFVFVIMSAAGSAVSETLGIIFVILAILSGIASAYFFKTRH
ncbi:hypothetical protein GOV03_02625 [Candidatus Woesearchaeota archaeon]|nr:hypothetical protein [Candidatus Woesearchaeota archaeon]